MVDVIHSMYIIKNLMTLSFNIGHPVVNGYMNAYIKTLVPGVTCC